MIKEVWKQIPNIEYFISNKGNIKNKENIILRTFYDKDGYECIKIHNKYINKHFKIHRLVAQAFLDDYSEKLQVNHLNGIKNDNRVENLEMATASENMQHSDYILKNRIKKVYQYDLEGNFIQEWESTKDIFDKYGFNRYSVSRVCCGKRKTAYGFIWKYAKEANNEI